MFLTISDVLFNLFTPYRFRINLDCILKAIATIDSLMLAIMKQNNNKWNNNNNKIYDLLHIFVKKVSIPNLFV